MKTNDWRKWLIFYICMMLFGACEEERESVDQPPIRTILLYMAGDNDLSSEVHTKLEQVRQIILPPASRIIAYIDTRDSSPQLLELTNNGGTNAWNVVREYAESNSADAETFGSVLSEVKILYPTRSYGLIFFSHASGWMPIYTYGRSKVRSVAVDKGIEMEITDFAAAIPDGMLDFIVFEACHMAGIEVAWELKNKTSFIIASSAEIVSPGFAPVYSRILPCLFEEEANLKEFVQKLEEDFRSRSGDYSSYTFSLIDLNHLDELASVVRGCDVASLAGRNDIQPFDRSGKDLFFDFGDCFSQLLAAPQVEQLRKALDECVLYKASSGNFMSSYGGFPIVSHSGLTTYIPQERYPELNEAYKRMSWCREIANPTLQANLTLKN